MLEIVINWKVSGTDPGISCDGVLKACEDAAAELKPIRGRPADASLVWHVRGFMLVWEWATGNAVRSSLKSSTDVYDPRLSSDGSKAIAAMIRAVDPQVLDSTIVRIIYDVTQKRMNAGMSFADFFPFYDATMESEDGLPQLRGGRRVEGITATYPIYCS